MGWATFSSDIYKRNGAVCCLVVEVCVPRQQGIIKIVDIMGKTNDATIPNISRNGWYKPSKKSHPPSAKHPLKRSHIGDFIPY